MKSIVCLILFTIGAIDSIPIEPEPLFDVEKDAQIHLYTLENPFKAQRLITNNTFSITTSNFNPKVPTRIFIHGFQSGQGFTGSLKKAYLMKGQHDINLIGINWEKGSNTINYPSARKQVKVIGQYTAQFIDFMVENDFLKLSDLIVIGFSLGAHAAGFTGKNVRSGRLPKIVGLDPASVLFSINKPEERLNSTDADYVETVQSSKLGFFEPIGTVAFYPNGGRVQPGCSWDETGMCSHSTTYRYFAQTVSLDIPFYGDLCSSLDDIKKEKCDPEQQAIMGGEPGPSQQRPGMYHIRMVPDPDDE